METIRSSLLVNNPSLPVVVVEQKPDEEIRMRGLSNLSSQMRAVTKEDYVIEHMQCQVNMEVSPKHL